MFLGTEEIIPKSCNPISAFKNLSNDPGNLVNHLRSTF